MKAYLSIEPLFNSKKPRVRFVVAQQVLDAYQLTLVSAVQMKNCVRQLKNEQSVSEISTVLLPVHKIKLMIHSCSV